MASQEEEEEEEEREREDLDRVVNPTVNGRNLKPAARPVPCRGRVGDEKENPGSEP